MQTMVPATIFAKEQMQYDRTQRPHNSSNASVDWLWDAEDEWSVALGALVLGSDTMSTRMHVCRVGAVSNHSGNSTHGQSYEEILVSLSYLTAWYPCVPICVCVRVCVCVEYCVLTY